MLKRIYPGRLTLDEWRALPRDKRSELAKRAQCDLLGSFRYCTNKRCLRARTCSGDQNACHDKLWRRTKIRPKPLGREYARLARIPYEF
jgi:hypothetical protein